MNITTALEIIQDLARPGKLLETLEYMGDNLQQFDDREVLAYRIVMRDFRKMFA
jgi:hypothetical protein